MTITLRNGSEATMSKGYSDDSYEVHQGGTYLGTVVFDGSTIRHTLGATLTETECVRIETELSNG